MLETGSQDEIMKQETWKEIHDSLRGAWAVLGPLLGVFIGAYIANRNQRKHWVAENKKQEYRELLSMLVEASSRMISLYTLAIRRLWKKEKYAKMLKDELGWRFSTEFLSRVRLQL